MTMRYVFTLCVTLSCSILAAAFQLNMVFDGATILGRKGISRPLRVQRTSFLRPVKQVRRGHWLLGSRVTAVRMSTKDDTDEGESLKELMDQKEKLEEKLAAQTSSVSPADEKESDLGLSQFGLSTGTTTLQRAAEVDKEDVGTIYADLSNRQLSYPALVLDRLLDGLEDSLTPKPKRANIGAHSPAAKKDTGKAKVVILGSGWGAHALIKTMDATKYDVCVISPRNFFVFTPMLAGAATGTVECRSITEPIREANPFVNYLEATATGVDVKGKSVQCQSVICDGAECSIQDFQVPYDKLIVSVGASVNTFGIPGVKENCYFLKQVGDASSLRQAIGNTFERANLPDMSSEERTRTLTFVIAGAGPTGVEFTAELRDFIEQDVPRYYPDLLPHVRIKLVEASDRVLMQFQSSMQKKAVTDLLQPPKVDSLSENFVELLLESAVQEVTRTDIKLKDGTVIPYGIAVWAAGIGPLPITLSIREQIGEEQEDEQARGRVVVDRWLRAQGADDVLAIGDCSCVRGYPLPATAQVAAQQGTYLGRLLNKEVDMAEVVPRLPTEKSLNALDAIRRKKFAKPFQFLSLGILAYTGSNRALAEIDVGSRKLEYTGNVGWLTWRSAYLTKQVSLRNQCMVAFDWVKTSLFGRDLTRF